MTSKQQLKVKSSIVNTNNHLNGIFTSFDFLNNKFSSGFRLIDNFPNYFSCYRANYKDKKRKIAYLCQLDILSNISLDSKFIIIILNTSIRNNIVTSISHIHFSLDDIRKTIHHAINVTSTEAELFAIRCDIN